MKNNLPVLLSFTALLTGCLGGSSGGGSSSSSSMLSGLAATGAPVSNGSVDIKGRNGTIVSTTTDSSGAYGADVQNLTEPFLIMVTTPTGEKLISVASQSDVEAGTPVNVTPLTNIIVANVFQLTDADSLFDDFETQALEFTEDKVTEQKDELKVKLAGVLAAIGVSGASIDLMNGTFVAGSGAGMDKLLDALDVNVASGTNIEIKIKGNSTPVFTDDVTAVVAEVPRDISGDTAGITDQLTALSEIKTFYNTAGGVYSAMSSCNGAAVDDDGACDKDTLQGNMLAFLHTNYKWDGLGRLDDVWGWICSSSSDGENESTGRANCNYIKAGNITFKDVTIVEFKVLGGTDSEAIVSMNTYMNGVYKGSDTEYLKKLSGVWKFNGNQRKYRVGINAQSIHKSVHNLSNVVQTAQEKFGAEISLWADTTGAAGFLASSGMAITAVNEDNSANQVLNVAIGGHSTTGLVLEVNTNNNVIIASKKFINFNTQVESASCNYPTDPCGENHNAQNINLNAAALTAMENKQKFKLTYTDMAGAQTDYFYVNKPMNLTASNAASVMPAFASNTLCSVPASSYLVLAPSGTELDYGSVYLGLQESNMSFTGVNDHASVSGQQATMALSGLTPLTGTLQHGHFWLKSRDEFDRSFVRIIECRN